MDKRELILLVLLSLTIASMITTGFLGTLPFWLSVIILVVACIGLGSYVSNLKICIVLTFFGVALGILLFVAFIYIPVIVITGFTYEILDLILLGLPKMMSLALTALIATILSLPIGSFLRYAIKGE